MVKHLIILLWLALPMIAGAQLKYDANWVFGKGCGINFNDPLNPQVFNTLTDNFEPNASISDADGNLQLYVAQSGQFSSNASIYDASNRLILNGSGIFMAISATNGAVFLPVPGKKDSLYLFHIGTYAQNCNYAFCYYLYYTKLARNSQGNWEVISKNILLSAETVEESIALVKHSNGNDWWLLIRQQRPNAQGVCNSTYLKYHINSAGLVGPSSENVLGGHCTIGSYAGETAVSASGKWLASASNGDSIYIYDFNRCTGGIQLRDKINGNGWQGYGAVFFNDNLYISDISFGANKLYEYTLTSNDINTSRKTIWSDSVPYLEVGQMESSGNNVFISFNYQGGDSLLNLKFKKHLSLIKYAGTDSAFLEHYSLSLGGNSASLGLPNFPNYNLGPEGVFLANAGKDTTLCNNTNSSGVTIGAPPVPNVTYLWQPAAGLSAANIAQPTADPAQSMWYYLTATDTTATSCAVNTDSVYVKVETCTGITETQTLQAKVYPNPTIGTLTIELPNEQSGNIELYNLLGQKVFNASINGTTILQMELPKGVYIYLIDIGGRMINGKLLVE